MAAGARGRKHGRRCALGGGEVRHERLRALVCGHRQQDEQTGLWWHAHVFWSALARWPCVCRGTGWDLLAMRSFGLSHGASPWFQSLLSEQQQASE